LSLVLDCSATLAWLLEEEHDAALGKVFERVIRMGAVVPSLWRLEVANSLLMAVRRGRIAAGVRDAALADLGAFAIVVDGLTDAQAWTATLFLAEKHRLTAYDAAYLELAKREALPLATLDRELRRAAVAEGVELLG